MRVKWFKGIKEGWTIFSLYIKCIIWCAYDKRKTLFLYIFNLTNYYSDYLCDMGSNPTGFFRNRCFKKKMIVLCYLGGELNYSEYGRCYSVTVAVKSGK